MSDPELIRLDVAISVRSAFMLRELEQRDRVAYEWAATHANPVHLPRLECPL